MSKTEARKKSRLAEGCERIPRYYFDLCILLREAVKRLNPRHRAGIVLTGREGRIRALWCRYARRKRRDREGEYRLGYADDASALYEQKREEKWEGEGRGGERRGNSNSTIQVAAAGASRR